MNIIEKTIAIEKTNNIFLMSYLIIYHWTKLFNCAVGYLSKKCLKFVKIH